MVKSTPDFKGIFGWFSPQILCLDKSAAVDIRQINDIDATRATIFQISKGVVGITNHDFHPGGGLVYTRALGVSLWKQFCHAIFAVNLTRSLAFPQDRMQLLTNEFFAPAFHPTGLHHNIFWS